MSNVSYTGSTAAGGMAGTTIASTRPRSWSARSTRRPRSRKRHPGPLTTLSPDRPAMRHQREHDVVERLGDQEQVRLGGVGGQHLASGVERPDDPPGAGGQELPDRAGRAGQVREAVPQRPRAVAERRGQLAAQDVQRRPVGRRAPCRRAPGRPLSSSAGAPPLTARRPARERVSHAPPASSASSGDCSNCCTSASASLDVASARSVLRPTQNRASAARLGSEVRRSTWGTAAGRADHVDAGRARSPATTQTSLAVPRRCIRTGSSSRTTRPRPPGSTLQPASPEGDRVATTIVRTTTLPGLMASPRITGAVPSSRRAWAT